MSLIRSASAALSVCLILACCSIAHGLPRSTPPPSKIASLAAALPISSTLDFTLTQYLRVLSHFLPNATDYPWWGEPTDVEWRTRKAAQDSFTNGFFPGQFFYLSDFHQRNATLLHLGEVTTTPLLPIATHTSTHDIGFVMMSSYGHWDRITNQTRPDVLDVLKTSANSLASRYSPVVQCIRSWDSAAPTFTVIIDNMMNLELLFYTAVRAKNETLHRMAVSHANRTMHEHVRPDGSTWHVVVYNQTDGSVIRKETNQGYNDTSTWSRGQAWGIYGFTMAYRYTRYGPFLATAQRLAAYFITHVKASKDSVPYWDFLAPYDTSYQPRDTSAAAIASSGLVELSQYVRESALYLDAVGVMLGNLTSAQSPYYVKNLKVALPAILINATTGPWHGFDSPAPFNVGEAYADYYLTEALVRLDALARGAPLPLFTPPSAPAPNATITVNWANVTASLKTTPTLQMVVHPLLTRASPIHDAAFRSLAALNATHARFASWFPFPRLSMPALDPPSGVQQCRDVGVGYEAELTCPGGVIDRVEFAAFGLPDGRCGGFTRDAQCDAANATAVVSTLCVGKVRCVVPATVEVFGQPCGGQAALRLAVQVRCNPDVNTTYWDFRHLDPLVDDFWQGVGGRDPVMNFCTVPSWLFNQSGLPVHHAPDSPVGTDWGYETGTQLLDPTCKAAGDWFGRLAAWYIRGQMTDEYGHVHKARRAYPIRLWEVLNEELHEHAIGVGEYICLYDAIVAGVRQWADPGHEVEFVGMAYANVDVEFYDDFRAFLNHSNHKAGTPLDWVSYHWYSQPSSRTDVKVFETFFSDNEHFITVVQDIEAIRMQLSPETRTTIDEVGVTLPGDNDEVSAPIPALYWNAAGAAFAHLFALLAPLGIDVLGSSQMMGSPLLPRVMGGLEPQFPSVTLLNWTTGEGTARYWVLKVLIEEFRVGDALVETTGGSGDVFAQGWARRGDRWVLVVNTKSVAGGVTVVGAKGGRVRVVDEATGNGPARQGKMATDDLALAPFAVAVVHLPQSEQAPLRVVRKEEWPMTMAE